MGRKLSSEHIEAIRNSLKGKLPKNYALFREAARKANVGRKASEETRRKMSLASKGKPRPNVSKALKGRIFTEEWKKKISESKRGEKNAAWTGGSQTYNCLYCNEEFQDYENRKAKRKFCSISCGLRKRKITNPILIKESIERRKEYMRKYRKRNIKKIVFQNNHRRTKKKSNGFHTLEEWERLKEIYQYMCLCCSGKEPEIKLTEDHIVPISEGGTNYIWNIQPLCNDCNMRKFTKTIDYRPTILIN